jgi:hypothetical protein
MYLILHDNCVNLYIERVSKDYLDNLNTVRSRIEKYDTKKYNRIKYI